MKFPQTVGNANLRASRAGNEISGNLYPPGGPARDSRKVGNGLRRPVLGLAHTRLDRRKGRYHPPLAGKRLFIQLRGHFGLQIYRDA